MALVTAGTGLFVVPALASITVTDDAGQTVTFAQPPQRIVTLLPSLTETVCALGACDRLVGTDRYSNWPASVATLPKLGGLDDAQLERTVSLKPDVVLAASSSRINDRLIALGIPVLSLEPKTHAQTATMLHRVAALLGRPEAGDALWRDVEARMDAAAGRVPAALRRARVYFEVAAAPYAAGAGSFVGETLARLGLGNIVPADMGPFPKLNPEYIVRAQPDVVMASADEVARMAGRPGWSSLKALQTGSTCAIPFDRYEIVIRPGPRLGEAADVLADCLQRIAGGAASAPVAAPGASR